MKSLLPTACSLALCLTSLPLESSHAQEALPPVKFPENYSALMTIRTGEDVTESRLARLGSKTRVEVVSKGLEAVTITDEATGMTITLLPRQKTYMELSLRNFVGGEEIDVQKAFEKALESAEFKEVGKETVQGQECVKYEAANERGMTLWWVNAETRFPVQMTDEERGSTFEWSEFSAEVPDASLFEIPADYQKLDANIPNIMQPMEETVE